MNKLYGYTHDEGQEKLDNFEIDEAARDVYFRV